MDQQPTTPPADEPRPLASSDAASAPARRGFTLRGRTWVYGATLAAAGVLAGSGVTYAVVHEAPASSSSFPQDGSGARGPMGAPPDGQAPGGQPSTSTGEAA